MEYKFAFKSIHKNQQISEIQKNLFFTDNLRYFFLVCINILDMAPTRITSEAIIARAKLMFLWSEYRIYPAI